MPASSALFAEYSDFMADGGRYYFVADVHLGLKSDVDGFREKTFVKFLDSLPEDTKAVFFLGDIFDFWVDYKAVVPRGYTRVLGRFAALSDRGVKLWFFKGNHDWWMTDYFKNEFGAEVVDEPYRVMKIGPYNFCLGHGDSLNCSDWKARFIFWMFRNKFLISSMKCIPPRFVFSFAKWWAQKSRSHHDGYDFKVEGSDILKFAEEKGRTLPIDYYVFGHFHTPQRVSLKNGGELIILGDWSKGESYLYLSGMSITGLSFPNTQM